MLFKWLKGGEIAQVGTSLAEHVVELLDPAARGGRAGKPAAKPDLQEFLQKFLQQVDRETRALKLNIFTRARLANTFKWRLLEKDVEAPVVDELTRALVLRVSAPASSPLTTPGAVAPLRRRSARDVQALLARGNELLQGHDNAEALECYQELLQLDSRNAAAHNGMGAALAQLGRFAEAEEEFRRAIGIRSGYAEAYFNLAGVLQVTGRYYETETPLRRALKLRPSYVAARVRLGMCLVLLGRLDEGRDCYEKALKVAPRNSDALMGLGQIQALEGRFAEAEAAYRAALEADPAAAYAWAALAGLRKMSTADAPWVKRAEELAGSGLSLTGESTLRFAIGKYYDDVGEFAKAFRNFQRANELSKTRAQPYDRKGHVAFVNDLIRVYSAETLAQTHSGASDSERPVFVVGMPRSGTSLVEQIIASHPAARGAGELNFWSATAHKHEDALRHGLLAEPLRKKLAQQYLRELTAACGEAERVVDKAPVNADYLGLIHSVFPRARILWLRRDPIDTCLSCYFQQFPPTINYAMDLTDLAHYYKEHQRLMTHWRRVLPAQTLLEVPYAELTAEQEKWSRTIVEFIGLPWDERCLQFHATVRPVSTASVWQVRQKMYRSSVGRWHNYRKFIGPLLELSDTQTSSSVRTA